MSVIFIDTDSELPFEKAKELNLDEKFIIKMPYTICEKETFYDLGSTYDAKEFFSLVRNGNMPITSGLNAEIYKEYFEPFFEKGEDILYVSFSDELSGTFKYHDIAIKELSEKYPKAKYRRFNTKGISLATGLPCYYAVKMHNEGKSNDEIIEFLTEFCPRVCASFSPNDLFYLKKGGRLSAAKAALGSVLQIKPVVRIDAQGKLYNAGTIKGRKNVISTIANEVAERVRDIDKYPIIVLNGDCREDADKMIEKIKEKVPDVEIWDYYIGPVIGTHCGPDTIACVYVADSREYA